MLSRGKTPRWQKTRGTKYNVALSEIEKRLMDPITFWKKYSWYMRFYEATQLWYSNRWHRHCYISVPPLERCSCPQNERNFKTGVRQLSIFAKKYPKLPLPSIDRNCLSRFPFDPLFGVFCSLSIWSLFYKFILYHLKLHVPCNSILREKRIP